MRYIRLSIMIMFWFQSHNNYRVSMLCDVDYIICKLTTALQVLKVSLMHACQMRTQAAVLRTTQLILFFLSFTVILFTINVVLMHSLCIKVMLILITKRS